MKTTSNQIKVGAFTAMGFLSIMVTVFVLGSKKNIFSDVYELKVELEQSQGLSKGSVVSLSGLHVGNISKIQFEQNKLVAYLTIEKKYQKRITEDSLAKIKTQGALGDKFIYIEPGSINSSPIPSLGFLHLDNTKDLFDMISEKAPQLDNITALFGDVRRLVNNLNDEDRSRLLVKELIKTSQNISRLSEETYKLMHSLRSDDERFQELTQDPVNVSLDGQLDTKRETSVSSMDSQVIHPPSHSSLKHSRKNYSLLRTLKKLDDILTKIDNGDGTLGALINDPSLHERLVKFFGKNPRNSYLKPLIRETIKSNDHHGEPGKNPRQPSSTQPN